MNKYVHGYSERESKRLCDQAETLDMLLHHDSVFTSGSHVLEAGCGVGSQTRIIAPKNPLCRFTSVDISSESVEKAKSTIKSLNIHNVEFQVGNIFELQFEESSFDHIFICFVLEHLSDPLKALTILKKYLKKGGTITVIEGDHGSTYFYPHSIEADKAIKCQVQLQAENNGNALIGREIYPLLCRAGFSECRVSPRMVYVDASKPQLVEGFIKNTFTAMIEGVEKEALSKSLITPEEWRKGINGLYRTAKNDGVFCYTFFKGIGVKE
jgi:SAM-dependent methyltransferase